MTIPRLSFADMQQNILGKTYDLSLAFVTPAQSKKIATQYKHKSYEANVLSFRLSKNSGEIIICPSVAKRQAKDFDTDYRGMIARLFIHGCFHLKGQTHGSTMESNERRMLRTYGFR